MTGATNKELAHRRNDGIDVTLLWNAADGRLTVTVFDARTGESLELPARPDNALDVYSHPFAYAGFPYDAVGSEPALAA